MKKRGNLPSLENRFYYDIRRKLIPFIPISFGSETINIFLTFLDLTLIRRK